MRVCAEQGCWRLSDTTRCELHTKAKRRESDRRRKGRQSYSNPKWRRTRAAYLDAHPFCQWPDGCGAPATDVHHIDGEGHEGSRGHDPAGLTGYCHSHHSKLTAMLQPGGFHAR